MAATNNDIVRSAERMLAALENDTSQAAALISMTEREAQEAIKRRHMTRDYLLSVMSSKHVVDQWRAEGRQSLAVHPEIVRDMRMATSDKISGEALKALPYINPMVVFPDPPAFLVRQVDADFDGSIYHGANGQELTADEFYVDGEQVVRMLGFICYGKKPTDAYNPLVEELGMELSARQDRTLCNTHDPDADYLGVMVICESLNAKGVLVATEMNTLSIPMVGMNTIAEMCDGIIEDFKWAYADDQIPRDGNTEAGHEYLARVLRTVIGTLMYLASTTLDAEKLPRKATAKMRPTMIARKPLSMYKVGWTLGSALSRYRAAAREVTPSQQGDITHQQDPHQRKGHFKMQPYGPGRVFRRLTYIAPYWVHRERLGERGINTARRVLSRREDDARACG